MSVSFCILEVVLLLFLKWNTVRTVDTVYLKSLFSRLSFLLRYLVIWENSLRGLEFRRPRQRVSKGSEELGLCLDAFCSAGAGCPQMPAAFHTVSPEPPAAVRAVGVRCCWAGLTGAGAVPCQEVVQNSISNSCLVGADGGRRPWRPWSHCGSLDPVQPCEGTDIATLPFRNWSCQGPEIFWTTGLWCKDWHNIRSVIHAASCPRVQTTSANVKAERKHALSVTWWERFEPFLDCDVPVAGADVTLGCLRHAKADVTWPEGCVSICLGQTLPGIPCSVQAPACKEKFDSVVVKEEDRQEAQGRGHATWRREKGQSD